MHLPDRHLKNLMKGDGKLLKRDSTFQVTQLFYVPETVYCKLSKPGIPGLTNLTELLEIFIYIFSVNTLKAVTSQIPKNIYNFFGTKDFPLG